MTLELRPATDEDTPACAALLGVAINRFAELTAGEELLVADVGGEVVGLAGVWHPESFLHHLYVAEPWRDRGVGSALLGEVQRLVAGPLWLKVQTTNVRAQRFYARHGLRPAEEGVGDDGPWIAMRSEGPGVPD